MTAFASFITQRNQDRGVWVLKIDSASPVYLSTIPIGALSAALPIISKVSPLSQTVSHLGGTAQVTTLTVTVLDVATSGGTYKASSVLYSPDVIGARCVLYYGDSTAATWDETNFSPIWRGYVRACDEKRGVWDIRCEGLLSKAKIPLEMDESFLTVAEDFQAKDHTLKIKGRRVMPDLPTLTELATNATFDASLTGWTWTCVGGSATWGASYGRTGGGVRLNSGATNTGMFWQTITLPAGHKPGTTYAVTVDAKTNGTPTATRYQGRVQIDCLDSGGTVLETATGTARQVRIDGTWGTHSACITVYHPSAASLKIGFVVGTDGTTPVSIDNFHCYAVSVVLALKRELLAALAVDESATPNTLTVAHSVLSTRENFQPEGEKGKVVKVLAGYGSDIALRLLTTTKTGTNGAWDYGDGFGCGIDIDDIDTASFTAARTALPYHTFALLIDKTVGDCLRLIQEEILTPMGAWIYEAPDGKLALGILPESVGTATITLTDAGLAGTPSLTRKPDQVVNQVSAYSDYDYLGAVETTTSRDLGKKANNIVVDDGGPKGDTKYIGRWTLDENDHRQDGAFRDQALTSQGRYGKRNVDIKAKGLRGLPSYSAGAPCPLFNWGSSYTYAWRSEEALRSLATRFLTYYTVPPCYVEWPAFSDALAWEIGDVASITSDYLPNVPTGGHGITAVKAILVGRTVDPASVTVKTTWLILDSSWYQAPVTNQPVYSYGTAPSAANVDLKMADADDVKAGNFPYVLSGKFAALIVKHNYGGVTGKVPDFNAYAYTEVRIQWNSSEDSHTKGLITTARFRTSRLMIAIPGSLAKDTNALEDIGSITILWRYRDGTYSTAYTYGSATPGSDVEGPPEPQEVHLSMQVQGRLLAQAGWDPIKTHHLEMRVEAALLARASWDGINIAPSAPTIGTLTSTEKDIPGTKRVECDLSVPVTFSASQRLHVEVKEWDGSAVIADDHASVNVRGATSKTVYFKRRYHKGNTLYVRAWTQRGTGFSDPTTSDANWDLSPPTVPSGHSITAGSGAVPSGPSITGLAIKKAGRHQVIFMVQWSGASGSAYRYLDAEITTDGGTTWESLPRHSIWNRRTTGKARYAVHTHADYDKPQVRFYITDKYGQESSAYPSTTGTDSTWWATYYAGGTGDGDSGTGQGAWEDTTGAAWTSGSGEVVFGPSTTWKGRQIINLPKKAFSISANVKLTAFGSAYLGVMSTSSGAPYSGYALRFTSTTQADLFVVTAGIPGTSPIATITLGTALPTTESFPVRLEVHAKKVIVNIGLAGNHTVVTDTTHRILGWHAWIGATLGSWTAVSSTCTVESMTISAGRHWDAASAGDLLTVFERDTDGYITLGGAKLAVTDGGTEYARVLQAAAALLPTATGNTGGTPSFTSQPVLKGSLICAAANGSMASLPTPSADLMGTLFLYRDATYGRRLCVYAWDPTSSAYEVWWFNGARADVQPSGSAPPGGIDDGGGSCFEGATEVLTPDGPRRIDSLRVGELVMARVRGQDTPSQVLGTAAHRVSECLRINGALDVTAEHLLFVALPGEPDLTMSAGGCTVGTRLYGREGAMEVQSIERIAGEMDVYSITVQAGRYWVRCGASWVLAHNLKTL